MKCLIKQNLLFRDSDNPSVEVEVKSIESSRGEEEWDSAIGDLEDDEGLGFDDNVLMLD